MFGLSAGPGLPLWVTALVCVGVILLLCFVNTALSTFPTAVWLLVPNRGLKVTSWKLKSVACKFSNLVKKSELLKVGDTFKIDVSFKKISARQALL